MTINPESAHWRRVGTTGWRDSGTTESGLTPDDYQVEFSIEPGYDTESEHSVTVEPGETADLSVEYTTNNSQYPITASVIGQGGRVTGGNTYQHNALARLEAIADKGYVFAHWKDDKDNVYSTQAILEIRATAGLTLTAHFRKSSLSGILLLLLGGE